MAAALSFQNCVILDSNKTGSQAGTTLRRFQNCVILDSNKTLLSSDSPFTVFQNCVILDSNKTIEQSYYATTGVLELCYFRQ